MLKLIKKNSVTISARSLNYVRAETKGTINKQGCILVFLTVDS
jgi:hypothetical protein